MTGTLLALSMLLAAVDGGTTPDGGGTTAGEPKPIPAFAIRDVATSEPVVALTFDACATGKQANGFDRQIWDILAAEQIPVTFYLSGRWVQKHPSATKLIAAAPWVELGNHSYSHPRLTLLSKERLRMQIRYTNRILEKKLGRRPLTLRPPAGAWDKRVVRAASDENLPVVGWSVISGGVGGHLPPERMEHNVVEQAKPGSIIISHINRREPMAKKALPGIIAGLRDKGLHFVTVSQLLALPDAEPEPARQSRFGQRKRPKPPAATGANPTPASEPLSEPLSEPSSEPSSPGEEDADPPT